MTCVTQIFCFVSESVSRASELAVINCFHELLFCKRKQSRRFDVHFLTLQNVNELELLFERPQQLRLIKPHQFKARLVAIYEGRKSQVNFGNSFLENTSVPVAAPTT